MRCLTDAEVETWLKDHSIPQGLHHGSGQARFHIRFHPPVRDYRRLEAFTSAYCQSVIPEADTLSHITDWAHYTPGEMSIIDAIRFRHGERRSLIAAPGHLQSPGKPGTCLPLFALAACFEWSAYLYSTANFDSGGLPKEAPTPVAALLAHNELYDD